MPTTEARILDDVSIEAPWALVETFSRMPRWRPEDVNRGGGEIVKRLRDLGLPVTVHQPELYLSIPFEAQVVAGDNAFRAKPPAYSINAPDGVEAELVYVPATYSKSIGTLFNKSQDEDLARPERIGGKIVISEGFSFPGKILDFERAGAVGVIAVNIGVDIHWGICTSIWGTPDLDDLPRKPGIAVAAVNNPDGLQLIEMAKAGKSAKIVTRLEEGWYPSTLPVVDIKGTEEPESFVLLHGHYDSWDVGVGDNATGDATMLEVARVLWKHRDKLKRSVRIAWWPGHSTGRYAGSTWFADAFAIDLSENCVAQVNCDSPGCRWATVYKDQAWMSETVSYVQGVIRDVTDLDSSGGRPLRAGDYAFNNIGISSFFMLSSTMPDALRDEKGYYVVGGCGGNIAWHTENDTIEIADKDVMLTDIKIYLGTVLGLATAKVIPFDWRRTTKEFLTTIAGYQKAAGDRFDLGPARRSVEELGESLDRFHGAIDAGTVSSQAANRAILDLARILVPVNFTRVPRFRHDPALPVPPLPTLSTAADLDNFDEGSMGFARTQLTRGQNRVVAALRDARRCVERALG